MSTLNENVAALVLKLKHVPNGAGVSMPGGVEVLIVENGYRTFDGNRGQFSEQSGNDSELLLIHRPTGTKHKVDPESEVVWHVQRHEKQAMLYTLYTPGIEIKPLWNPDGFPVQPNQL